MKEGWMKERRDSGLEGFRTRGVNERRDSGLEGFRTKGMRNRIYAGQWLGGMQDLSDEGK